MNKVAYIFLIFFSTVILILTRFYGLDWGLPYPMHPDERNMVVAITQMNCQNNQFPSCLDPKFYAYGQLPLFIGLILSRLMQWFDTKSFNDYLLFENVVLALRFLSATASVLTVFILSLMLRLLEGKSRKLQIVHILLMTFVPVFIQFAHFGTTESLLQLYIVALLYISILWLYERIKDNVFIFMTGLLLGFALATKVSSLMFTSIPLTVLLIKIIADRKISQAGLYFLYLVKIGIICAVTFIVFSPFNIISFDSFIHSINYESEVGLGEYKAFYTRQFEHTLPIVFQFINIFPYALGWPFFLFSIIGFSLLPYNKHYNFLRIIFILIFVPNAIMYAKWTRFIAPVYPILMVFSVAVIVRVIILLSSYRGRLNLLAKVFTVLLIFIMILKGVAFTTIYFEPDVRFKAAVYIYEKIEKDAVVLSETANVVDIPMPNKLIATEIANLNNISPISFNFYELHHETNLNQDLSEILQKVDYIFVPSRRIFFNHTCYRFKDGNPIKYQVGFFDGYTESNCGELAKAYPQLQEYYNMLFESGKYEKIAEFSSYPRIEIFGNKLVEFNDESAEETFTVFDHPVIRIYKRKEDAVY